MAKISLRGYNRDIEQLIKQDKIDEAIAHCKYILKLFPKNIDTYRLLGQAFLENQQYTEASDIFKRILAVTPDDFISNYGISIISEDEGNLDAAIWHMERAFEIQPSNAAIQADLKRLFGRRDGVEPLKIRLSRGALIRMYVRGELYPQAISEIEAALSEDPQRIDLQVTLAKVYSVLGRKDKVKEICTAILEKSPYCYEPNKLMGEIVSEKEAHTYLERVIEIDPYASFLTSKIQETSQIPEHAIMMEKLEWDESTFTEEQPSWAVNMGVNVTEDTSETPDWLSPESSPESPVEEESSIQAKQPEPTSDYESTIQEEVIPAEISEKTEGELPEWMKTAGWEKSDKTEEAEQTESYFDFDEEQEEEEEEITGEAVIAEEIPDWLTHVEPEELEPETIETKNIIEETTETGSVQESEEQGVPLDVDLGWLESLAARQGADQETLITSAEERSEELPEWLAEIKSEEEITDTTPQLDMSSYQDSENTAETVEIIIPDFNLSEEVASEDLQQESETGDYDADEVEEPTEQTQSEWFTEEKVETEIKPELTSADELEEEELPDWLSEKLPVEEEEIKNEEISLSQEELPDWLKDVEEFSPSDEEPAETLSVETKPDVEISEDISISAEQPSDEEPALPDWLKDFEQPEGELLTESSTILEQIGEEIETTDTDQPEITFKEELIEESIIEDEETSLIASDTLVEEQLNTEESEEMTLDFSDEEIAGAFEDILSDQETETESALIEPVEELGSIPDYLEDKQEEEEATELSNLDHELLHQWEYEAPSTDEISIEGEMVENIEEPESLEVISLIDESRDIETEPEIETPVEKADLFIAAKQDLNGKNVDDAISIINDLIKSNSYIPEVIDALRDATSIHPYNISLWQSLGDAYAKSELLQDALDAYTQAEILLR